MTSSPSMTFDGNSLRQYLCHTLLVVSPPSRASTRASRAEPEKRTPCTRHKTTVLFFIIRAPAETVFGGVWRTHSKRRNTGSTHPDRSQIEGRQVGTGDPYEPWHWPPRRVPNEGRQGKNKHRIPLISLNHWEKQNKLHSTVNRARKGGKGRG